MSNPLSNTESRNNAVKSNKAPSPKTLAEFYAHAWSLIFNKLSKEEQRQTLTDLAAKRDTPFVNRFVKNVAELGEEMFDKSSKVVQVKG